MKSIKIPFRGITRNTDDGVCADGESMELINARIKNNSVEPIGNPILLKSFSDKFSKIYFHPLAKKHICIREEDGTLIAFDENLEREEIISTDISKVTSLEFMGNIVCANTNKGIQYVLYKDDTYIYLGNEIEMPILRFNTVEFGERLELENVTDDNYAMCPYYTKLFGLAEEKGLLNGITLVRYAVRMHDGNYIKHSPIFAMQPESFYFTDIRSYLGRFERSLGHRAYDRSISAFGLFFKLVARTESDYDQWFKRWGDVVLSVDIFISRPICYFKITSDVGDPSKQKYVAKTKQELIEEVESVSLFYKVASFKDLKSLNKIETWNDDQIKGYIIPLEDKLKGLVVDSNAMKDDNFTHDNFYYKQGYVYNSKLHIANVDSVKFKGFSADILSRDSKLDSDSRPGAEWYIEYNYVITRIRSNDGSTEVLSEGANRDYAYIDTMVMYPDINAYEMEFLTISGDGPYYVRSEKYTLKKSTVLNMAYYIYPELNGLYGGTVTNTKVDEFDITNYIKGNNIINRPNILKVSSLNNPFYFPVKTTYSPSSSEIIALSSNTTALSQGQFGQHPLLIFCKDGIYAMSVGTGDTVYSASTPLSRDVCNNPDSVTCIDNAVVFSTVQGIKMMQGSSIISLSDALNGYLPSCIISSPIISKILGVGKLQDTLSEVVFQDYIKEAKIGYNYREGEIIISNRNYLYSYLYNLESGTWSKLSLKIDSFANFYPYTYAVVNNEESTLLYDLNNSHRSISTIGLISRPIKMGSNAHKRILQSALRGIVKRSLSDLYLRGESVMYRGEGIELFSDVGFYILGSNDAEHYSLIAGKESIVDLRDLMTKMNKSKPYKYFIVALVGGVRTDVSINYLEMIADESFNNRLR